MSRTIVIEDEFGQVYSYNQSKFNLDFPMSKIGIPSNSTIYFSNVPIGDKGLTDKIVNDDPEILILSLQEILDRIRLSNIKSIELQQENTNKMINLNTSRISFTGSFLILLLIIFLVSVYMISIS